LHLQFQGKFLLQVVDRGVQGKMQKDNRELKKNAFQSLREQGHTYDDIKRILGCSERTLYNWSSEADDEQFQGEQQQTVEVSEREQQLQNQINELSEHIDNLSNSYTRLWNQVHLQQKYAKEEVSPFEHFFEVFMANSERRQDVLSKQLDICRKFEMDHELIEGRDSKPEAHTDIHFNEYTELAAHWNKELADRSGVSSADIMRGVDIPRRMDNVQLESETPEGIEFEKRISDMCFKREVGNIVDGIFQKNSRNSQ